MKSGLGATAVLAFGPETAEVAVEPKFSWKVGAGVDDPGVSDGKGDAFPDAACVVGVNGFWAPKLGKRLGVEAGVPVEVVFDEG